MYSQGPAGDKLRIPLTRPPSSPLRRRHKPTAIKKMHSNTSHPYSVQATGGHGSSRGKWYLCHAATQGGRLPLLTGLWAAEVYVRLD